MLIGDEDGIEATQALCFDAAWASLASLTKARYAARLFSLSFHLSRQRPCFAFFFDASPFVDGPITSLVRIIITE